ACASGNGRVRSPRDNVASFTVKGGESVSRHHDCQHHGGRELGSRSTVNSGEPPVNAVICSKPKMLTGLDQKVRSQVPALRTRWTRMPHSRRRGGTQTPRGAPPNLGKPL